MSDTHIVIQDGGVMENPPKRCGKPSLDSAIYATVTIMRISKWPIESASNYNLSSVRIAARLNPFVIVSTLL